MPDADAKAAVDAALNFWSLGGSYSKVAESHTNVATVADMDWIANAVLLRYEIKGALKNQSSGVGYDVTAILVFQSKAGTEITKQRRYHVFQNANNEGPWHIAG